LKKKIFNQIMNYIHSMDIINAIEKFIKDNENNHINIEIDNTLDIEIQKYFKILEAIKPPKIIRLDNRQLLKKIIEEKVLCEIENEDGSKCGKYASHKHNVTNKAMCWHHSFEASKST